MQTHLMIKSRIRLHPGRHSIVKFALSPNSLTHTHILSILWSKACARLHPVRVVASRACCA